MSHLRVRPIEKPFIIQSITYNHRQDENYPLSDASFLKLSEKNSQQLFVLKQSSLFAEMQNRLDNLQSRQAKKMKGIQESISRLISNQENRFQVREKIITEKQVEKNVSFRILQEKFYDNLQAFEQQSNFQMDENLNYIKNTQQHRSSTTNLVKHLIERKQMHSEPQNQNQRLKLTIPSPTDHSKMSKTSRRNSLNSRNTPCSGKDQRGSITKRNNSVNSNKTSRQKSNRVYQQILANYSTAKLLAMQKGIK